LLALVFYSGFEWRYIACSVLFAVAGITDALDGYVARKYGLTTPFGAFLDPVADKLMVAVALALLIEENATLLFTLPATVIIGREIVISALREWMAELGKRANVAVSNIGKIKTTCQIVAIVILLAFPSDKSQLFYNVGIIALYIASILTLWSMFVYLRAAWPSLSAQD